jgi:hypothetical protein
MDQNSTHDESKAHSRLGLEFKKEENWATDRKRGYHFLMLCAGLFTICYCGTLYFNNEASRRDLQYALATGTEKKEVRTAQDSTKVAPAVVSADKETSGNSWLAILSALISGAIGIIGRWQYGRYRNRIGVRRAEADRLDHLDEVQGRTGR